MQGPFLTYYRQSHYLISGFEATNCMCATLCEYIAGRIVASSGDIMDAGSHQIMGLLLVLRQGSSSQTQMGDRIRLHYGQIHRVGLQRLMDKGGSFHNCTLWPMRRWPGRISRRVERGCRNWWWEWAVSSAARIDAQISGHGGCFRGSGRSWRNERGCCSLMTNSELPFRESAGGGAYGVAKALERTRYSFRTPRPAGRLSWVSLETVTALTRCRSVTLCLRQGEPRVHIGCMTALSVYSRALAWVRVTLGHGLRSEQQAVYLLPRIRACTVYPYLDGP